VITYVIGDATNLKPNGIIIIAHVCNDIGVFSAGFALAIANRHPRSKTAYEDWHNCRSPYTNFPFCLGEVQLVRVVNEIYVANMIGQHGIRMKDVLEKPPIRYEAVEKCLTTVATLTRSLQASIHMPRIGCGLAGSKWEIMEPIISKALDGLSVYVYDLPHKARK